ncbi:MAG: PAS domain-containing protein [Beijerinckiaceae bacterium]|nr:PAS domain-containing protein [Beijerinckiaceae bacterium]
MVVTNPVLPDNPIIFANDAFLALTGYAREEVTGRNCRFLQGPETDPAAISAIRNAISQRRTIVVDLLNYKKDGTPFWIALHLSPVLDAAGAVQYFFASQIDVTDRKKRELSALNVQQDLDRLVKGRTKDLEDALIRTTLLLDEADHRLKNNLQLISAMLMLQSMSNSDVRIKVALGEMLERVDAMALVHMRLYQSDKIEDLDIAGFTREIAGNLVTAAGRDNIRLSIETESVRISADQASSIALVINEVITNALKYAFPAGRVGHLEVGVKPLPGSCEILIRDDGPGMPQGMQKSSFGKTLIETLIQQLEARIEWLPASPGTLVRIVLPLG